MDKKYQKQRLLSTAIADEMEMALWYKVHAAMVDCPATKKLFLKLADDEFSDHVGKLIQMVPDDYVNQDLVDSARHCGSHTPAQQHWTSKCPIENLETAMMLETQTIAYYDSMKSYKDSGLIEICPDCTKLLDSIIADEKSHLSQLKALYKKALAKKAAADKVKAKTYAEGSKLAEDTSSYVVEGAII